MMLDVPSKLLFCSIIFILGCIITDFLTFIFHKLRDKNNSKGTGD